MREFPTETNNTNKIGYLSAHPFCQGAQGGYKSVGEAGGVQAALTNTRRLPEYLTFLPWDAAFGFKLLWPTRDGCPKKWFTSLGCCFWLQAALTNTRRLPQNWFTYLGCCFWLQAALTNTRRLPQKLTYLLGLPQNLTFRLEMLLLASSCFDQHETAAPKTGLLTWAAPKSYFSPWDAAFGYKLIWPTRDRCPKNWLTSLGCPKILLFSLRCCFWIQAALTNTRRLPPKLTYLLGLPQNLTFLLEMLLLASSCFDQHETAALKTDLPPWAAAFGFKLLWLNWRSGKQLVARDVSTMWLPKRCPAQPL